MTQLGHYMRFFPQLFFRLPESLKDTRRLDEESRYDLLSSTIPDFILSRQNPLHWQNELRHPYFRHYMGDLRNKRVAELACGWGFLAQKFAADGATVTAYDISRSTLLLAADSAKGWGNDIQFIRGRTEELPFADECFDAVTCTDALEHVEDLEKVITEASRILAPGGIFGFVTVNKTFLAKIIYISLGETLMGMLPKGTHNYRKFVPPRTLTTLMTRHGLILKDIRGILVNPFIRRYHFWPSESIEYIGVAQKR